MIHFLDGLKHHALALLAFVLMVTLSLTMGEGRKRSEEFPAHEVIVLEQFCDCGAVQFTPGLIIPSGVQDLVFPHPRNPDMTVKYGRTDEHDTEGNTIFRLVENEYSPNGVET